MSSSNEDFIGCGSLISLGGNRVLIGWGQRTWQAEPAPSSIPSFFFPDFFLTSKKPWFIHAQWEELEIEDLMHLLALNESYSLNLRWHCPFQELFRNAFGAIQKKIATGELKKAVPFVFEEAGGLMDRGQLTKSLQSILQYAQSKQVHVYGYWDQNEGILGATPEVLFQQKKVPSNVLQTMACAGTYSSSKNGLLEDPKEFKEHQLVVDGIVQSLSPYGKVNVQKIKTLDLPHLSHLVTPIQVSLKTQIAFEAIVRSLHPTPALGAFPRENGMHWLKQYETLIERKRFGAPVGVISGDGVKNCYAAIRNLQWDRERLRIGAGCGVVAQSVCEKEWEEIHLKIHAIKEMLAL